MSAGAASCRLPASQLLMRKIDRYILAEVSGPLLFGIGAFVIILVSVDILGNAFRLIFEQGIPAHIVGQAFVYQLPQTIALTIPMGTLFGVLTAMGRLSGDGEIVAMHAGGIGFPRLTVPVVALGVALSVATLVLNETIAPPANKAARRLLAEAGGRDLAVKQHYTLQIPPEGTPDKLVYAAVFDTRSLTLHTVLIIELRAGSLWEWFKADSAQWKGEQLILHNVTHFSNDGRVTTHISQFTYNVGKSPEQAARYDRRINDMSMAELRQQIRLQSQVGPSDHMLSKLRQQYHSHAAIPWCALGFALLAMPLGMRPQRTSTGIGLGVSLAIILLYYVVFYLLGVMGENGAMPAIIAAWLPNIILYLVGIGLIVERSR